VRRLRGCNPGGGLLRGAANSVDCCPVVAIVVDKVGESGGVTGSQTPPRVAMAAAAAAETDRLLAAGHQDDEDEDVTVSGDVELSTV
jgi:hypothetical protein